MANNIIAQKINRSGSGLAETARRRTRAAANFDRPDRIFRGTSCHLWMRLILLPTKLGAMDGKIMKYHMPSAAWWHGSMARAMD